MDARGEWKPAAHAYALFAAYCNHSVIRHDLADVSGGIAASQLRQVLYRRENGDTAVILWFEPELHRRAAARVAIDLGQLEVPAIVHDIASGHQKPLLDAVIELTEKPVMITYRASGTESPVVLAVTASPVDTLWLVSLVTLLVLTGTAPFSRNR